MYAIIHREEHKNFDGSYSIQVFETEEEAKSNFIQLGNDIYKYLEKQLSKEARQQLDQDIKDFNIDTFKWLTYGEELYIVTIKPGDFYFL